MSRVGKIPIKLPENVRLEINGSSLRVSGPKGELERVIVKGISVEKRDGEVLIDRKNDNPKLKAFHGTTRALVANMIKGVTDGWIKVLELVGTGYRAKLSENKLVISVGFSHPVEFEAPEGIVFKVDKTLISIEGIDKELVGLVAARIRAIRPPEPYKGKGIRYQDEEVRRKPGKAAKAQGTAI
jgi:large subunit ribosomal protein L6